jgi:lipid II:glycine glycyltransferase (peptidoglycan interpeptide bridge formation enzyme)
MGEVYRAIGQEPLRWEIQKGDRIIGICFGHIVPARRGKHLAIPYGPIMDYGLQPDDFKELLPELFQAISAAAKRHGCSFIRMSPFLKIEDGEALQKGLRAAGTRVMPSPLHLLAEHIWYLPLTRGDRWKEEGPGEGRSEEELLKEMRSTQRNLIRRAGKDGVTISLSTDPVKDLHHFLKLHDETRKRHGFTPYSDRFFRAQVEAFAPSKQVLLYLAHFQDQVIAASIHMTFGGETSYHHGASAAAFRKIPANYLLQWTAITDALKRGDSIYNFWGIAPVYRSDDTWTIKDTKHPFAGVTLFKTGFGGNLLELQHCLDLPLKPSYHLTRGFEMVRKWRRGF